MIKILQNQRIVENYKNNRHLVLLFLDLTKKVFPWADFSSWYEYGFWPDEYIPYSIIIDGEMVSNISITKMDILMECQLVRGIQIGTVGTIPEFRGRGLSGTLMKYILAKYKDDSDLFFLFANSSVLEFYPKYGFSRKYETLYYSGINNSENGKTLKKLNWKKQGDLDLIQNLLKKRLPLTSMFGAENYQSVTLWHMINIYSGDIYYDGDQNMILIFYLKGETLHLIDLIFTEYPDMEKTLSYVSGSGNTSTICFHFPPDIIHFSFDRKAINKDNIFFTRGKFNPPDGYKFPVTAQT